jgi:MinD-like ATPase involved in chromosome partitioning or flagellar assembly
VELPTYTSIWRIEKRLYKLYDFRLPMPLPVGQIAVFAAIAVPYLVLLALLRVPVSHTLFWLYVLPPGAATWLATRPVVESKRLVELIVSQVRYLAEPRTWGRLAPLAEPDDIMVTAWVWRRAVPPAPASAEATSAAEAPAAAKARAAADSAASPDAPPPARPAARPVVTATGNGSAERPVPGRPDRLQRDRARARLPIAGPRRIVVLGCAVGAGQTVTTLMTGETLAGLRAEPVCALDLNPARGSLTQRCKAGRSRLAVTGPQAASADDTEADPAALFERASAGFLLTFADPGARAVPQVLGRADQLLLVVPAGPDAAGAITMTREWLDSRGHARLADTAIVVLNGVSQRTRGQLAPAETVARSRCRAIVRIPWDDGLGFPDSERESRLTQGRTAGQDAFRSLAPGTVRAYTALAGVLVASLAADARRPHAAAQHKPAAQVAGGQHPGRPAAPEFPGRMW